MIDDVNMTSVTLTLPFLKYCIVFKIKDTVLLKKKYDPKTVKNRITKGCKIESTFSTNLVDKKYPTQIIIIPSKPKITSLNVILVSFTSF